MTPASSRPFTGPIGVLALQGDFAAHARALEACGAEVREVRLPEALGGLAGLVMPGGESTTLLRFLREHGFDRAIPRFLADGGAIYGTCAGAILLAKRVLAPEQWSLGLLDADIERNAYGRQADSYETDLRDVDPELLSGPGGPAGAPLPAVFIRAPRFRRTGPAVRVLASLGAEPVLVRQGSILAGTYHPELTGDLRVHRYFLGVARGEAVISRAVSCGR
jgi:5'-phosphate synthase pdxT subunit